VHSPNNLLILGAGQYGVMAAEIAEAMGVFDLIAFLDDSFNASAALPSERHCERSEAIFGDTCHSREGGRTVLSNLLLSTHGHLGGNLLLGVLADLPNFAAQFNFGFVAIGNLALRRKLTEQLKQYNFSLATLVHPTAYVSPSAQLEPGCCVEPNATVQTAAVVKQATFIASGAVIRHNATVGEFCHVDCNAVVDTLAVVPAGTHILAQEAYRA
jgi:hypothetical protein